MPFDWTIVGNTGYDVEDVEGARTHEMTCPSCNKRVRFVEKELIKNLRVFGVPLVGVEQGRRVFECSNCRVCVEPPDAEKNTPTDETSLARMRATLRKLDDEVWLWNQRIELARKHGDRALEDEGIKMKVRAERDATRARETLASAGREPDEPPGPGAIIARRGGAVLAESGEGDFAALKRRLADRQSDASRADAPASTEAESAADSAASEPTAEPGRAEVDVDAEFERIKGRLATRRERGDDSGHEDVVQRDVPAAPRAPDAEPDPDDPVAALKRKLRPTKG